MPTIKLRNGSGVPTNGTLAAGEPALDLTNKKLYTSTNGSDVVEVSAQYVHPTHPGDDFSVDTGALTGATVVSDIDINVTTDTLGHVTDANGTVATRTLTLANLGYTGATNADLYSSWSIAASGTAGTSAITSGNTVTFTGAGATTVTRSGDNITISSTDTAGSGTVTSVSGGNGLTGTVTTSGSLNVGAGTGISVSADAVALATAGAGAGTYGSTSDSTKIDQITLDAYGRVTAITTGATGSSSTTGTVTSVTGGNGLTGSVTTSGSLAVGAGAGMHVNANDVALYSSVGAGGSTTLADEQFRTVTAAGQTITLPASPAAGDTVYISNGNITTTTVARNGSNISGLAENMTIDVANIGITLVYSGDATQGWRLM